jgi:hypothetical protein
LDVSLSGSERCEVEEHISALPGVEALPSSPQTVATMTDLPRIDDDHLRSLTRQSGRTAAVPMIPSVDQCHHQLSLDEKVKMATTAILLFTLMDQYGGEQFKSLFLIKGTRRWLTC